MDAVEVADYVGRRPAARHEENVGRRRLLQPCLQTRGEVGQVIEAAADLNDGE